MDIHKLFEGADEDPMKTHEKALEHIDRVIEQAMLLRRLIEADRDAVLGKKPRRAVPWPG